MNIIDCVFMCVRVCVKLEAILSQHETDTGTDTVLRRICETISVRQIAGKEYFTIYTC